MKKETNEFVTSASTVNGFINAPSHPDRAWSISDVSSASQVLIEQHIVQVVVANAEEAASNVASSLRRK